MPQVAAWVAAKATAVVAGATTSLAAAQTVYAVAYYGTQLAITVGLSALASSLQGTPDSDAVQGSKKQPVPPRIRGAGRRKMGGWYVLWEAKDNQAFDVLYVMEGPIEAVQQVWSHDKVLTLDGSQNVVGSPEYGGGSGDLIHVDWRLGASTETAYSAITSALPDVWPSTCRGDGVVSLGADYKHAKKENLLSDFPNGDPDWSVTVLMNPVWDPRDEGADREDPSTWGGTKSNLALLILDHCLHATGMAMDWETEIAPAIAHWMGEADICDEDIPLAAGGTEKRYWGSYYCAIPADPQEALDKLLAACDGKLLKDQHGVVRLWVGKYRAPTVTLTDADIVDYDIAGDPAAFDACNEIVPRFVSEAENWTLVDTTAWRDEADIARRGKELSMDLPLECAHSGPLARRVGKAVLRRQQAPLRGTLQARLSAVEALGHRWIAVDLPDLGLDGAVLEVETGGRISFSRGAVDFSFVLGDPQAYDWNAATEEQSVDLTPRPPIVALDPPEIDTVTPFAASLGSVDGVRLAIEGSGPDRDDLTWFVRWRETGEDSWSVGEVADEAAGSPFIGSSGFVAAVASLDVAIGFQTGAGSTLWSATVTADTSVAPPPAVVPVPSGLVIGMVGSDVRVSFSITAHHGRVLRALSTEDFEDAVDVSGELTAPPGVLIQFDDLAPTAATYRYWAAAENIDDVPSDPAGPVEITVS
jgi:hypothetical protein